MITVPRHKYALGTMFGVRMQHSALAIWVLEAVLNSVEPASIIEIGTDNGGLTVWLGAWAHFNDAQVLSIDCKDKVGEDTKEKLKCLPVFLETGNVFDEDHKTLIANWLQQDRLPALLYCDGSEKFKEMFMFTDYARKGSVIGCHDYINQVDPKKADAMMADAGFVKIVRDQQMRDLACMQMFWVRT